MYTDTWPAAWADTWGTFSARGTALTAEDARLISHPRKFDDKVVFSAPGRMQTLRDMILPNLLPDGLLPSGYPDARVRWEWNVRIMGASSASIGTPPVTPRTDYVPLGPISPWDIDEHYGSGDSSNAEQLAIVNADFEAAADMALRWHVTGEDAAAEAAVRILFTWAQISGFATNAGSVLNWNDKWPLMIQAALMVRDHPAYTAPVHAALQDVTRRGLAINSAFKYDNNWDAWGVCYLLAAGIFLEDRVMFDRAIQRWRTLFDVTVVGNVPIAEVYREGSGTGNGSLGLWYSNFFLYGMTAAAEWARFAGEWLYDYVGPDGSTFEGLYENVRYWTRNPALFPYNTSGTPSTTVRILAHDDILYALWPHADGLWLLENFLTGSIRDNFGIRQAVLTYRDRPLIG